jgi:hypothetical protein
VARARRLKPRERVLQQISRSVLGQLRVAGLTADQPELLVLDTEQRLAHAAKRRPRLERPGPRKQQRKPPRPQVADQIGRPHGLPRDRADALDQPRLVDSRAERHAVDLEHAQRQLLVAPASGRGAPLELVQEAVAIEDPCRPAERAPGEVDKLRQSLLERRAQLEVAVIGPDEHQRTVLDRGDLCADPLRQLSQRSFERLGAGIRRRQQARRIGQSVDQGRLRHCPLVSGRRAAGLSG